MNEAGAGGVWQKLRRGRGATWEETIAKEVDRLTAGRPPEVKILIPAPQSELGGRLERAARLMKAKGYRLHMVAPEDEVMWAAGFELSEG